MMLGVQLRRSAAHEAQLRHESIKQLGKLSRRDVRGSARPSAEGGVDLRGDGAQTGGIDQDSWIAVQRE